MNWTKYLPRGARRELADEFGVTPSYITQVLTGARKSPQIIDAALTRAEEERARIEALEIRKTKLTL